MTIEPTPATNPFGVYIATGPCGEPYEVSRTGIVYYHHSAAPQVLSMVNGAMCVNPLGEFICSVNFDAHALDVLSQGYHLGNESLAYFDPTTNTYTTTEPAWHAATFNPKA